VDLLAARGFFVLLYQFFRDRGELTELEKVRMGGKKIPKFSKFLIL